MKLERGGGLMTMLKSVVRGFVLSARHADCFTRTASIVILSPASYFLGAVVHVLRLFVGVVVSFYGLLWHIRD